MVMTLPGKPVAAVIPNITHWLTYMFTMKRGEHGSLLLRPEFGDVMGRALVGLTVKWLMGSVLCTRGCSAVHTRVLCSIYGM